MLTIAINEISFNIPDNYVEWNISYNIPNADKLATNLTLALINAIAAANNNHASYIMHKALNDTNASKQTCDTAKHYLNIARNHNFNFNINI